MSETHRANETCSCGAKIDLDVRGKVELKEALAVWRSNHRHDKPAAPAAQPEPTSTDPGSVTTTATVQRAETTPPTFGFAPRRRL